MKKLTALLIAIMILLLGGCASNADLADARTENGIVIALLDTGVSQTAINSENLLDGWNYVTSTADTEDRINHGTAVTSVILGCESAKIDGMAPNALIVPLVVADKVEGNVVYAMPETLAQAIRDSVDKYGASVINVSLGTKKDNSELRSAIDYVQNKGALVIAAAGNSGDDELYYPAAYDGVLTVGSHDKNYNISDFTQQNETVDILAPGEDIWLASRNGKTYGAKGTSYANAYVSAAAVRIWENNTGLNAKDVKKKLLENTIAVDGWRILNLFNADDNK